MSSKSSKIDVLPAEIITHLHSLQLPREAFEYIDRCLVPSTTPTGVKSYTVRYPCGITNQVLELNSRDIELAQVLTFLADPQVAYYIPQPAVLELDVDHPRARFYPPDFLVIYKDKRRPLLLETKPSTHLAERAAKHPERFTCSGQNGFEMPLAAAAAAKLGFDFRVICERHFDETFLRNVLFLESYRKWTINPPATDEEKQAIKDQVAAQPGIKLIDVKHESMSRRADLIHHLLAVGEIFAHLSAERLTEPNRVALYPTAIRERALALFEQKNPPAPDTVCPTCCTKASTSQ